MRCNKAQEYLGLELDGVLPPDATVSLSNHLDSCADCVEFRDDLLMGRRMLHATEPELPDNFDWKLQLRLNQALKETAGEVAYPWEDKPADRLRWVRNFGSAAAVGMAAVLALAIFTGPTEQLPMPVGYEQVVTFEGTDRLPLKQQFDFGSGLTRQVSGSGFNRPGAASTGLDKGWSGQQKRDLRTIQSLREKNRRLNIMLYQSQLQNNWMRAQLDTSLGNTLDLGED